VTSVFDFFDLVMGFLRVALFVVAAGFAIVFGIDWLVRTRRLNAFGPLARFFRRSVDPWLAPIERRVVKAGGTPSSAPWWALVVVVVGGILLLAVLTYLRGMLEQVDVAFHYGPRGLFRLAVQWAFLFLRIALIVRVASAWIGVSQYSRWVRWSFPTTEWMLRPLRRFVPLVSNIDVTPIVAWFALVLAEWVIVSALV
jgi:YggT family protein